MQFYCEPITFDVNSEYLYCSLIMVIEEIILNHCTDNLEALVKMEALWFQDILNPMHECFYNKFDAVYSSFFRLELTMLCLLTFVLKTTTLKAVCYCCCHHFTGEFVLTPNESLRQKRKLLEYWTLHLKAIQCRCKFFPFRPSLQKV